MARAAAPQRPLPGVAPRPARARHGHRHPARRERDGLRSGARGVPRPRRPRPPRARLDLRARTRCGGRAVDSCRRLARRGAPDRRPRSSTAAARVFGSEALRSNRPVVEPGWRRWRRPGRAARLDRARGPESRFRSARWPWRPAARVGQPRSSAISIAPSASTRREVLRLEEQPEDEDTRTPLERGRFLHEIVGSDSSPNGRSGGPRPHHARTRLPAARASCSSSVRGGAGALSPSEAALERARLLGSAVGARHRASRVRDGGRASRTRSSSGCSSSRCRASSVPIGDGRRRIVTLSAKIDRDRRAGRTAACASSTTSRRRRPT